MSERRDFSDQVGPGWGQALEPVRPTIEKLGDFLRAEQAAGRRFLPSGDRIFAAFQVPLDQVKVLIVGQDPYPTPGHPIGLCFAVAPDVRPLPKSLQNIFTEYTDDLGHPPPSSGDLTPWVDQGVMLLNRALTVRPHAPASHRGQGWEEVTQRAIEALAARARPLVSILWGSDARSLEPMLQPYPAIQSPHPSPLSAHRGFFGSQPFSRANGLLERQGAPPIDWRLP
ncbi:MAG TPA: uracil-DNA glycosylase [Nitriliruptorales bacterium]